jgi:hypothetical protein
MKNALLIAVCLLSFSAAAQTPPPSEAHQEKLADIRKLMTLTGGDKMANQMLDQIGASMRASAGPDFDKYFAEFRAEFDLNKVFDLQIAAYDKYLSAEDVKAMVRFYESPAGKRMVEVMPQIMGDMMAKAMQMSQETAAKVAQKMKEQQQK